MVFRLLSSNGHDHLGIYSNQSKAGLSTNDAGHKHIIIPNAEVLGEFVATPGEDGHEHEVEELKAEDTDINESEEQVMHEQIRLFKEAHEFIKDAIEEAEEDEEFYHHKQWDEETISILEENARAHATLNHIEPMMDVVTGSQRQNRQDLKFMPIEEGDQVVADILNVVTKVILTENNFEADETRVFENCSGPGLGVFNTYIDYSENIKGKIKVEWFNWKDVRFGQHENPDLRDCEYIFKLKWFSAQKLKQLYPKEFSKISPFIPSAEEGKSESVYRTTTTWEDQGGELYSAKNIFSDDELFDGAKKNFRILERWQKEFTNVPVIVLIKTEEAFSLVGIDKEDVERLGTIEFTKIFKKETHRIRIIKTAGNVVLEDYYPDLAFNDFHIIPVFAKHYIMDGKLGFNGKIRGAKEPQRVINKNYSQVIDNITKVNSNVNFYDDETFGGDKRLEDEWKSKGGTPGHNQKVANLRNIPVPMQPPAIYTAAAQTLELSANIFNKLTNVNAELQGQQSDATSGKAILLRQKSAMVGNEYLFDNLSLAKKILGRRLVAMIQKIYTPERIIRIIQHENNRSPINVTQNGAQVPLFQTYPIEEIENMLFTSDLTLYDISVAESPYNATTRQYIFWSLAEIANQMGVPIPPQILIKHSEMTQADKQETIELIQQQQMMQQQNEQRKYDTEEKKALIGAMSKAQNNNKQG